MKSGGKKAAKSGFIRYVLLFACLLAVASSALPYMSVTLLGLDQDITIFGISELFSILGSFDVNRLLASVNIVALAEGVQIPAGAFEIPADAILSAMGIETLKDIVGEVKDVRLSIEGVDRMQMTLRLLYVGVVLCLILAEFNRLSPIRTLLGLSSLAIMFVTTRDFSSAIDALYASIDGKAAQVLGIYPKSVQIHPAAFAVFMAGMGLFTLLSIGQWIHAIATKRGRASHA